MPPKKKEKRVFQYKGPEADEIVGGREAPKKAERKKVARVGKLERDQAPAASRDGMSISERRLAEAMKGKKNEKKKRDRSDEGGGGARPEPAAVKRLKKLENAAGVMDPRLYKQALGQALREGLQEQRAEAVVVAKHTGKQTEKNRAYRQAKKEKKKSKATAKQVDREEDRKLVGTKEVVKFGDIVQAPPAMDKWVAKLESMKQKSMAKQAQKAEQQEQLRKLLQE